MKLYHSIPIHECGELLVPIPFSRFAFESPHAYEKLGAPYHGRSPFYLRESVLKNLEAAQAQLQQQHPGWRILVFDAFRPIAVQQFMVDYTFRSLVTAQDLSLENLTDEQRQRLLEQVYEFWAEPSLNPATPPPHSTGAAVDVTLMHANGQPAEMGSAIDELSPRSYPNYYATSQSLNEQRYHHHRELLRSVMTNVGFQQHPKEWWHFSWGDQLWAWLTHQGYPDTPMTARYGSIA